MAPISKTRSPLSSRSTSPRATSPRDARPTTAARASNPRLEPQRGASLLARSLSANKARSVASADAFKAAGGVLGVAKASALEASTQVTEAQVLDALRSGKTDDATRALVADYFKTQDLAGSHATMEKIRAEGLLDTFLRATVRDSDGNPPGDALMAGLTRCMETGRLDVYAETLATTAINVGDYEGKLEFRPGENAVVLDQNSLGDTQDLADILAHELFHAFAQAHGGGGDSYGAVNEGFGIAAREYAFTDGDFNLAEMVYGTKSFYRDFKGQPDFPLGDMKNADPKLREFLEAMADRDSSQLAWDDPAQLKREYDVYFQPIDRDQDWGTWLSAVDDATRRMLSARGKPAQQILDWLGSLLR